MNSFLWSSTRDYNVNITAMIIVFRRTTMPWKSRTKHGNYFYRTVGDDTRSQSRTSPHGQAYKLVLSSVAFFVCLPLDVPCLWLTWQHALQTEAIREDAGDGTKKIFHPMAFWGGNPRISRVHVSDLVYLGEVKPNETAKVSFLNHWRIPSGHSELCKLLW